MLIAGKMFPVAGLCSEGLRGNPCMLMQELGRKVCTVGPDQGVNIRIDLELGENLRIFEWLGT